VGFRQHLIDRLPPYARPLFLRIRKNMDLTGTFKYSKTDLVRQGFNPASSEDVIYLNHLELGSFTRLDQQLYERIQMGAIRF
jgi:fatty-acyl-CoA synthase